MKKIIAFAMSALLAVSAVSFPVSAVPAKAAVVASQKVEAPVVAYITGSTVILEPHEGYEYCIYRYGGSGKWTTSNIFTDLATDASYYCQQRLVGQAETESKAVRVTTKERGPCTVTPLAPEVSHYSGNTVELVERDGYEYRVNDGKWQNVPIFRSLEPDTEYVFYQRIAKTYTEEASEATQITVRTRHGGPSANRNLSLLKTYVEENGFENDKGFPTIAYSVTIDDTNEYYFLMTYEYPYLRCNTFNISQDDSFLAFDTTFDLKTSGNIFPETTLYLVQDGYCVDEVEALGDTVYAENYQDNQIAVGHWGSNYLSDDQISSLLNSTVAMACAFWDEFLYAEFGFGLKGLGFLRYDGYGEVFCSYGAGFHLGEEVLEEYRAPGCVVNGYDGNTYCSVCHGQISTGNFLYAKGSHEYDNNCDRDCNVCGEERRIEHIYSFACATSCDICGEVRTDPLANHSYSNYQCTKCQLETKLLGDVSGDGKVNMGDVAKSYAHIKTTAPLTSSNALTALDTNGDGKINLGDVSRILAHITGKKPLW